MTTGSPSVPPNLWVEAKRSIDRLERSRVTGRTLIGIAALVLSVVCVLLATLALGANIARLRESFGWVSHTNEVLQTISDIRIDALRAEASVRAYVLSGDAGYLAEYRGVHGAIGTATSHLASLVTDNPAQTARVRHLIPLLTRRIAQLDANIAEGRERVLSKMGDASRTSGRRMLAGNISESIAGLRQSELALLAQRQQDADQRTRGALFFALLSAALAVVSGALGAAVISRERVRHRSEALELELMHKQRGILMDQASSMLAHEINQPLTAASNYLGSAQRLSANLEVPRLSETIQKATQQIRRAGEIVRRLRQFIERQVPEQRIESASALVEEAISLLGTLDASVKIETTVEPGLPQVLADSVQIQQVLVNLMRNAIEAMEGAPMRALFLSARAASLDEIDFALRDTGSGITPDIARKLFRPLSSAKQGGMGVGLAICHTIISAHGGRIWAEPSEAGGAVFHFTLPAWHEEDQAAA
ncbi:MAG: CHASE3 domain-containing protein [Proteobacteria bacterium]|nr:CHASE3 domain-containing protein [Pseudomonadota bacterium]